MNSNQQVFFKLSLQLNQKLKVILIHPNTAYHIFIGKVFNIISKAEQWIQRISNINQKINLQVKVTQRLQSMQDIRVFEQVYKSKSPNAQSNCDTSGFVSESRQPANNTIQSRETANKKIWSNAYGSSQYLLTGENCFCV